MVGLLVERFQGYSAAIPQEGSQLPTFSTSHLKKNLMLTDRLPELELTGQAELSQIVPRMKDIRTMKIPAATVCTP